MCRIDVPLYNQGLLLVFAIKHSKIRFHNCNLLYSKSSYNNNLENTIDAPNA